MNRQQRRRVLLLLPPRRLEAVHLGHEVIGHLTTAGVDVVVDQPGAELLGSPLPVGVHLADPEQPSVGCELVLVLGGDGTILRGAELSRGSDVPLLGVNLGHVGFLAESEKEDALETVERILHRDYRVEDRMTLDVRSFVGGHPLFHTWALNEASVEKGARERMLELTVEIDGRPMSTWGCDGVVMATPTGSTAYAFSAGGPVMWPDVDAMLMVPISAHALFARPIVVGPRSRLAVEVLSDNEGFGVLWCDGRRALELPAGARIEVCRSDQAVRLVRLTSEPFTDRLVAKFDLSIHGWRGSGRQRSNGGG